ncbi:hypothetical protein D6779_06125 [Candidatus Parcubacteria bacterium]|nr:MAG: hypothetical protein D6779_06125 [Candidatus Parcubacteria bacterium]
MYRSFDFTKAKGHFTEVYIPLHFAYGKWCLFIPRNEDEAFKVLGAIAAKMADNLKPLRAYALTLALDALYPDEDHSIHPDSEPEVWAEAYLKLLRRNSICIGYKAGDRTVMEVFCLRTGGTSEDLEPRSSFPHFTLIRQGKRQFVVIHSDAGWDKKDRPN